VWVRVYIRWGEGRVEGEQYSNFVCLLNS
jgi:hypothetical protein